MDAGGDEDGVDPGGLRAFEVGAQRIPDGEDAAPVDLGAPRTASAAACARIVGIGVGLARPEHLPVHALVEVGDGAGADVLPAAHVDDEVGVGADEREAAGAGALRAARGSPPASPSWSSLRPVQKIASRLLQRGRRGGQPLEGGGVAVGRSDAEEARVALLGDVAQRDLAGGDDVVPGLARHARASSMAATRSSGTGALETRMTVPPSRAEAQQRVAGVREGAMAVVQHAPHVAEQHVVASEQLAGVRQGSGAG